MLKEGSFVYYYDIESNKVEAGVISKLYIDNTNAEEMWQCRPMMSVSVFIDENKQMVTNYTFPVSELGMCVSSSSRSHPAFHDTYEKAAADALPF